MRAGRDEEDRRSGRSGDLLGEKRFGGNAVVDRERRCGGKCKRADLLTMLLGAAAGLMFTVVIFALVILTQVILAVAMLLMPMVREVRVMLPMSGLARNGDRPGAKNEPRNPLVEGQHQADRQHAARDEQRQQHNGQHEMARYHSDLSP